MNEKSGISVISMSLFITIIREHWTNAHAKINILWSSLFHSSLILSKLRNLITKKCLLGPTKYRSFQACPFLLSKLVPQDAFQGTISAAVSSILLKSILNGGGLQVPVILGVDISNTSRNIDTWTRTYWCPIIYVLYNSGMYLEIRY